MAKKDKRAGGAGETVPSSYATCTASPEAGAAGADIVIVGVICRVSVGIAGGDIQYAGQAAIQGLHAPEATRQKQMLLLIRQTSPKPSGRSWACPKISQNAAGVMARAVTSWGGSASAGPPGRGQEREPPPGRSRRRRQSRGHWGRIPPAGPPGARCPVPRVDEPGLVLFLKILFDQHVGHSIPSLRKKVIDGGPVRLHAAWQAVPPATPVPERAAFSRFTRGEMSAPSAWTRA